MVAGDGQVPPADIIIDDLFYPTQNPFEFDAVSEAIKKVREQQNVLYMTAAGDHGQTDSSDGGEYALHVELCLQRRALFQLESDPLSRAAGQRAGWLGDGLLRNGGGDVGFMSFPKI